MATAPYRFIPIEPGYVQAAPVKREDIRFDKPLAEGSLSAVIDVEWTAKTPICVGAKEDTSSEVRPLKIGKRYCLPGTSLRGMLRSAVEIATFSHLGRINSSHHHGVRDFAGMGDYHSVKVGEVKAGWLKREGGRWRIYPVRHRDARFVLVPIDSLLNTLSEQNRVDFSTWQTSMSVAEKYAQLPPVYQMRPNKYFYALEKEGKGLPRACLTRDAPGSSRTFQSSTHPIKDMYVICTGPYRQEATRTSNPRAEEGTPKKNEALFPGPGITGYLIPDAWMDVFHGMHSEYARDGGNPRGAWRTWLLAKGWQGEFKGFKASSDEEAIPDCMREEKLGIPVFWKGDIANLENIDPDDPPAPGLQSFWFSLSRVMRVPHGYSVGDVAGRLYSEANGYHLPRMSEEDGWDFARAMFGEVDGANDSPERAKPGKRADGTRREDAQRGRVAIGFAFAPENTRPESASRRGVFGQPRESFWPFYLRHGDVVADGILGSDRTVSYSSEAAVPAGRKRTVVRSAEAPAFPGGNGNENTETNVRFLPKGTIFTGQIRVHNFHPVEFGALLYALTFGVEDGSLWHQLGRAKGMGHGAISPRVTIAKCDLVHSPDDEAAIGNNSSVSQWIGHFRDWMNKQMEVRDLPAHADHPSIKMLEAMANPSVGDTMAGQHKLDTGELPDFKNWRDVSGSQDGTMSGPYPLSSPLDLS